MRGTAAYSISKAAVSQMTRSLALEWAAHGIRVNAIAPGWFPSRMNSEFLGGLGGDFIRSQNPMKRLGETGDLDGVAELFEHAELGASVHPSRLRGAAGGPCFE